MLDLPWRNTLGARAWIQLRIRNKLKVKSLAWIRPLLSLWDYSLLRRVRHITACQGYLLLHVCLFSASQRCIIPKDRQQGRKYKCLSESPVLRAKDLKEHWFQSPTSSFSLIHSAVHCISDLLSSQQLWGRLCTAADLAANLPPQQTTGGER